jgi:hypothetical protein
MIVSHQEETPVDMRKLIKTERKVVNKIALSVFAEHLYIGLTIKKNYGLCEATRHWHAAKNDTMEYSFIEFPGNSTQISDVVNYLIDYNEHVGQLERLLTELGTLNLSSDELDALAKQRGEN